MPTHERNVERFYGHRAERRAREADGFLSFGYWPEGTREYSQSVENLLDLVLAEGDLRDLKVVLNVACGNGAETTRMYERLKPEKIYGIDITGAHIETCKKRAAERGLSDALVFQHGDACATGFPDGMFSHVLGIEGPAHFNTRESFFAECRRVLEPGGVLLLSDIVGKQKPKGLAAYAIARACLKLWHMPVANWIDLGEYREQLERNGFEVERVKTIGDDVFPGFASFNVQDHAIRTTIDVHGVGVGLGLAFIAWLLGYVHELGFCDYIIVRARKRA